MSDVDAWHVESSLPRSLDFVLPFSSLVRSSLLSKLLQPATRAESMPKMHAVMRISDIVELLSERMRLSHRTCHGSPNKKGHDFKRYDRRSSSFWDRRPRNWTHRRRRLGDGK